jgi:hypothetical protein
MSDKDVPPRSLGDRAARPPVPGYETNILITVTIRDVRDEISRAIDKHGIENTPLNPELDPRDAFICISEELGELAHELTYDAGTPDRSGEARSPEQVRLDAEKEAISVAAMAIAFVVGSRRRDLLT